MKFLIGEKGYWFVVDIKNVIISYVCENGDITKDIVVNDPPFDERLNVFGDYMLPLANYIDDIHTVIIPCG